MASPCAVCKASCAFSVKRLMSIKCPSLIRRGSYGIHDSCKQRLHVPGTVVTHAVDEERGRAIDPAAHPAHKIFTYALQIGSLDKFMCKPFNIQLQNFCESQEITIIKRLLILEEKIVHLPETPLSSGRLGRFRRSFGMRVYLREREVAKHKAKLFAQVLLDLFDYRVGCAAIRTLEVAVLNQCHSGCRRAQYMVARTDGQSEFSY